MSKSRCYRWLCQHMHEGQFCQECTCQVFVDPAYMAKGLNTVCTNCGCSYGEHYNTGRKGNDCNDCKGNNKHCEGFGTGPVKKELPIQVGYKFMLKHSKRHGVVTKIDGDNIEIKLENGMTTTLSYSDLDKNSMSCDPAAKYMIQPD